MSAPTVTLTLTVEQLQFIDGLVHLGLLADVVTADDIRLADDVLRVLEAAHLGGAR